MTRISILPMIAVLSLSAACAGENPVAPTPALTLSASKSANTQVSRPAGGSCTYNIHSVVPQPTGLFLDMTALCNLKHLGRTTAVVHQECYLDGSCANWTTYTAANGDILYSTWYSAPGQNSFDGLHAEFFGIETFLGGTGRFVGATGSMTGSGTADFDPATGVFTGHGSAAGTITY